MNKSDIIKIWTNISINNQKRSAYNNKQKTVNIKY